MLPSLSYGDGFVAYFGSFLVGEAVKGVDVWLFSTSLVMVSQMWWKMSSSHHMLEQEGRSEANDSIGDRRSTQFLVSRSMRVMAPNLAFTLR